MSKKHVIALADMIREHNAFIEAHCTEGHNPHSHPFYRDHREALADFCAAQNPLFNRERWLDYIAGKCGKNGGKVKQAA